MTRIPIPPAVLEAGARAAHDQWRHECAVADNEPVENWRTWPYLVLAEQLGWVEQARAAFEAMVEAWPDMAHRVMPYAALILPLTETSTKENDNG